MPIVPVTLQAYRASLLHFHADPAFTEEAHAWHADGLLIVAEGKVLAAGDYSAGTDRQRRAGNSAQALRRYLESDLDDTN